MQRVGNIPGDQLVRVIEAGGNGNDRIIGKNSNDILTGEGGNDYLYGDGGKDRLVGGEGKDRLVGNTDNDTINGGAGKDSLTGGSGTDKFVFSALGDSLLATYDVITDYTTGEQIDAPSNVIPTTLTTSRENAASLTAAAISAILTTGVFTGNSTQAFTVSGYDRSTFLAFNDNISGFNAATDSIIQLQDYTLEAVTIV